MLTLQSRSLDSSASRQTSERPRPLTLQEVVTEVNERAQGRPFGGLPEWRKAHKGKDSLPGTPFYSGLKEGRDYFNNFR